jgi:DNA-binding GntR family transcriptional regulator
VVKSLGEQVYEYLFDQLRQRALAPGVFLDLNEIAARLGISRTPLRDALIYLEVEGYVKIVPRRGVMVIYPELEEIRNLYQMVGALEAAALEAAALRFTREDHQRLRDLNQEYRMCVDQGSLDACLDANYAFHDYFLDRCGNAALIKLVRAQKRRLYDWPRHTELLGVWERKNLEEHEQVAALLEAGDLAGAVHILKDIHWSFSAQEQFIHSFYGEPGAGSAMPAASA